MTIRTRSIIAAALGLSLVTAEIALAQFVYPRRGQSASQQRRDEDECHGWARRQVGAPNNSDPSLGRNVLGGAARGATLGVVGGAIFGNAGTGAGAGAAMGALNGAFRTNDQSRNNRGNQNAQNQAFATCMEGRGYSVRF